MLSHQKSMYQLSSESSSLTIHWIFILFNSFLPSGVYSKVLNLIEEMKQYLIEANEKKKFTKGICY